MATTSKGIYYPTPSDNIAPLESHFAAMASSIDVALGGTGSGTTWTTYTPVLTGSTTNPTYTASGQYIQVGNTVHFNAVFTLTAAGSGNYSISLPVTAANTLATFTGYLKDVSAARSYPITFESTTTIATNGASTGAGYFSATSPVATAASDIIRISGTYRSA